MTTPSGQAGTPFHDDEPLLPEGEPLVPESEAHTDADPVVPVEDPAGKRQAETTSSADRAEDKRTSKPVPAKGNPVGWSGLLIAVVAVASQAFFLSFIVTPSAGGGAALAYDPPGLLWDQSNVVASLLLVIALLGSISSVVVAIVALSSKRAPHWISWVTIGVGLAVLIGTISFWQALATIQ